MLIFLLNSHKLNRKYCLQDFRILIIYLYSQFMIHKYFRDLSSRNSSNSCFIATNPVLKLYIAFFEAQTENQTKATRTKNSIKIWPPIWRPVLLCIRRKFVALSVALVVCSAVNFGFSFLFSYKLKSVDVTRRRVCM